jgi:hypothetical protein
MSPNARMSDTIYRFITSCQGPPRTESTFSPTSPVSGQPDFVINRLVPLQQH